MLYVLHSKQVVAEIKGSFSSPVVVIAYWAGNDQDLSLAEIDAFYIECSVEIAEAAYEYEAFRIAAGDKRGA